MARRDNKPSDALMALIIGYFENKSKSDAMAKKVKEQNELIKNQIVSEHLPDKFEVDDLKINRTVIKKSKFNDEQAIEILRKNLDADKFSEVVKTKEYIDDDALEALIYNKEIDGTMLDDCIEQLPDVIQLKITKKKGGK